MAQFGVVREPDQKLPPDFNVAPTKNVYTVVDRPIDDHVERTLAVMRWGLVPSWAKTPSIANRMINARIESAATKPAYRAAWHRRRALVPADGFYEWYQPQSQGSRPPKQPYFIHRQDGASLAMAGLYEFWRDPTKRPDDPAAWLRTVAVLTTAAAGPMAHIHNRMPVLVESKKWQSWLDPDFAGDPTELLQPELSVQALQAYPVSTRVNSVRNNGPELLEPLPLA